MQQDRLPNYNVRAIRGWCLKYVDDTVNAPKRTATAEIAYNNELEAKRISTAALPDGVFVPIFFGAKQGELESVGHIALAKRQGSKLTIWDSESNSGSRGTYHSIDELLAWFGAYKPFYRGWSTQCDGAIFAKPKPKLKSVREIAKEVIAGKWGNGDERKNKLTKAGYNYAKVQAEVNRLSGVKSTEQLAKEVIAGKYGTGETRKKLLGSAYNAVQSLVNKLLRR